MSNEEHDLVMKDARRVRDANQKAQQRKEAERDFQRGLDGKVLGTLVEGPKHHLCPDCGTDLTIVSRSEIPEDVRIATSKKGEGVPKRSRPGPGVTRH